MMLEYLIEKINNHTADSYVWHNTETCHTLCSKNSCVFIDNATCMVHTLYSKFKQQDFEKLQELYDVGPTYNFRIEKPIQSEMVILRSTSFLYTVYQRPEFGEDYSYDIGMKSVNTDYFIEFVDSATPLLQGLMVVNKKFNTGLPGGLIGPGKRLRDSRGYFFYDLRNWFVPSDTYVQKNIEDLLYQIDFSNMTNGNIICRNTIHQYMVDQWKNI